MKEKGFTIVVCLLILLLVTLLAVAGMQTATFGTKIAGNGLEGQKAFWIAESGLQDAKHKLDQAKDIEAFRDLPELSSPVSYGGGTYTITAMDHDPANSTVVVESVGSRPEAKKIVEATFKKLSLPSLGALYTEDFVSINAAKTTINGRDICGGPNKPAIITTKTLDEIDLQNGELYGNEFDYAVRVNTDFS